MRLRLRFCFLRLKRRMPFITTQKEKTNGNRKADGKRRTDGA